MVSPIGGEKTKCLATATAICRTVVPWHPPCPADSFELPRVVAGQGFCRLGVPVEGASDVAPAPALPIDEVADRQTVERERGVVRIANGEIGGTSIGVQVDGGPGRGHGRMGSLKPARPDRSPQEPPPTRRPPSPRPVG